MNNSKSVGPRIKIKDLGKLHSCNNFQSKNTRSLLSLRKEKLRLNTQPLNSIRLTFVKKISISNPVESFRCIKYYNFSSSRPITSLSNSIICIWLRIPETILDIRKRIRFLEVIHEPIIMHKFFKHFRTFLFAETKDETFQQSGKQDFFLLKSSTSTYESLSSHFFRTTIGIQSGSDAFDKPRLVMNFLTSLVFTEILFSFKLLLE